MNSISELLFGPLTLPPAAGTTEAVAGPLPGAAPFLSSLNSAQAAYQLPATTPGGAAGVTDDAALEEADAAGAMPLPPVPAASATNPERPAVELSAALPATAREPAVPATEPAPLPVVAGPAGQGGKTLPPVAGEGGKTLPQAPQPGGASQAPNLSASFGWAVSRDAAMGAGSGVARDLRTGAAAVATAPNPAAPAPSLPAASATTVGTASDAERRPGAPPALRDALAAVRAANAEIPLARPAPAPTVASSSAAAIPESQPAPAAGAEVLRPLPAAAPSSSSGQVGIALPDPSGHGAAAGPATADRAAIGTGQSGSTILERLTDPQADGSRETRRNPPGELMQPGTGALRQESAPVTEASALAAALDRRAVLELAGRQRSSRESVAAATASEAVDRASVSGADAPEQRAQQTTPRPVLPVLAARDLAALAERLETLVHRRVGSANVSLNLGDLGDVEISVRMESRQAHVQFVVQDAAVREALETQLPRLRALLAEGGLELGDVDMNLPGRAGSDAERERSERERQIDHGRDGAGIAVDDTPESRRRSGGAADGDHIIDAFA